MNIMSGYSCDFGEWERVTSVCIECKNNSYTYSTNMHYVFSAYHVLTLQYYSTTLAILT